MPPTVAILLVSLVALIHIAIAIAEISLWNLPQFHSRLDFSAEQAKKAAPIVANAGLYNSFLAAGLIWGLLSTVASSQIQMFFLICVAVAGVFGAVTLKPTTLLIQTFPAALALGAVYMAR
jgi:putative membrane protein